MKRGVLLGLCTVLGACASDDASHIPPVWQIPGAAAGAVIENGLYNQRRKRVKSYIAAHYAAFLSDIAAGGGAVSTQAFTRAHIDPAKQARVMGEIKTHPEIYQTGSLEEDIENITVLLMVSAN